MCSIKVVLPVESFPTLLTQECFSAVFVKVADHVSIKVVVLSVESFLTV